MMIVIFTNLIVNGLQIRMVEFGVRSMRIEIDDAHLMSLLMKETMNERCYGEWYGMVR